MPWSCSPLDLAVNVCCLANSDNKRMGTTESVAVYSRSSNIALTVQGTAFAASRFTLIYKLRTTALATPCTQSSVMG